MNNGLLGHVVTECTSGEDALIAYNDHMVQQAEQYHTNRSLPVLIQGETGVGKEIIAKIIHHGAIYSSAPFIDINCTAITPSLFESELFECEAGFFTGGVSKGQKVNSIWP